MKLSLIALTTILATSLLASSIPSKRIYEEARKSYDAKDFKTSYALFEELSLQSPENAEINFLLGRSALELKLYDEALVAFDRVLMLNPNHARTHLEIARVHYETEQYEIANTQLESILKENIPEDVKSNITQFKAIVESNLKSYTLFGSVSMGITYDSNTNNDIGNLQFVVPSLGVTVPGNQEKSDTSLYGMASLTHLYDIGSKGDWLLESTAVSYGKLNRHVTDNNLALFSLSTKPVYAFERYKIGLPVSFDKVFLSGEGYAKVLQAGAEALYLLDSQSSIDGSIMLKRSYYDQDSDLDAQSALASIRYRHAFGLDPWVLSIGTSYEKSNQVNGARTDVENGAWTHKIEVSKEVYKDLNAALSYTYTLKNYDDVDLSFLTKREDKEGKYSIGLSYMYAKDLSVHALATYTDHTSNHAPFEYDKTTLGINFIKSF